MTTIIICIAALALAATSSFFVYVYAKAVTNIIEFNSKFAKLEAQLKGITKPMLIINKQLENETKINKDKPKEQPSEKEEANKEEVKKDEQNKLSPLEIKDKTKIFMALKQQKGDIKAAAKQIMMPYSTFYRKAIEYGLQKYMKKSKKIQKLERMEKYNTLREEGKSMTDAAKMLGVCMQTAEKYELAYLKQ